MWPAIKLGKSLHLQEGYRVYIFNSKEVHDIPATKVISDFQLLQEQEVTFKYKGSRTGIVNDIHVKPDSDNILPYFIVSCEGKYYHVSYFKVYLTKQQAGNIAHDQ
ncbi:unnamed protein product [Callosobruchus maculatus]|uniref:Uncharacterized protein n=1 Tax=Callosobruchus maculatus TaxID=64391 RepID=A0A653CWL3_CALMS|nr:unnamed protein product [Callosobruchus maculatus]